MGGVNFRNSDCATVRVDYKMSTVQCVANTLFLTLRQVFVRIKSFTCVDLSHKILSSKIWVPRSIFCKIFGPPEQTLLQNQFPAIIYVPQ